MATLRDLITGILERRIPDGSWLFGYYAQTTAESNASITPVNFQYPPGHLYRYGTNTNPGTTDLIGAFTNAANACRAGNYVLQLPADILLTSAALDFSNITVKGLGGVWGGSGYITRSAGSSFDIVTSTGGTILEDIRVDGANPSATAGLTGDNISFKAVSPAHPYLNTLINVSSTNARARCCYIERGGYTSFFHVQFLGAGLHALECYAPTVGDECTTIRDYGSSQFGSCPHGFGIKLTECTSMAFHDSIIEGTQGIQLNGGDNRTLSFEGVYQENTAGGLFITDNGSGGVGLAVCSCFGGNGSMPFLTNWQNVYFQANSNLAENAIPAAGRIQNSSAGQGSLSATADVTAASMSLVPGTYRVSAVVQTIVVSGGGSATQLACQITSNAAASGLSNSTSSLVEGAAQTQSFGASQDARINCYTIIQTTSTVVYYLRVHIALSGSITQAYNGQLRAELIE